MAKKVLGSYLDAYARAYYRAQTVSHHSIYYDQIVREADHARRRLADHVRKNGYTPLSEGQEK